MSKEPSKADRLREMREAKFNKESRREKMLDLSGLSGGPNYATKRSLPPGAEEIKKIAATALRAAREREEQDLKKDAQQIAEAVSATFEEAIQPEEAASDGSAAPSHPDCKRCAQVREQTRDRVRRAREKKAEGKKP